MADEARRQLDHTLAAVSVQPGMYGLDGTYAMFVAFVHGFDLGSGGEALAGFANWLDGEFGVQRLAWERHVLTVAFPDEDPTRWPVGEDENRWTIDAAVVLLRRYLAPRG